MATALTEDHLTCTICYRPFREPKTLQCLHSFCLECIQQYINHAARVRGFPCPVCREITTPPDSMQPKSTWASQLKTDFKLKGILEAVNQIEKDFTFISNESLTGSEDSADELDDRKSQLKKLISLSDQLKSSSAVVKEQIDRREVTLRKMEEDKTAVESKIKETANTIIEDILTKEGDLLETLWMTYDDQKVELQLQIEDRQEVLAEMQDSLGLVDRLLSPGSEYATGEYLYTLQSQQDDRADFLAKSSQNESQSPVDFSFLPNHAFKKTVAKAKLGVLRISDSSGQSLIPLSSSTAMADQETSLRPESPDQIDNLLASSQERLETVDSSHLLRPDSADGEMSRSLRSRSGSNSRSHSPMRTNIQSSEMESDHVIIQKVFSSRLQEDEQTPYISGLVLLYQSFSNTNKTVIVMVDSDNECVKSFYEEQGEYKSHRLKLDNSPLCIAKLSCEKVLVGVLSYKLCIVNVTPDLEVLSTIETESVYNSMAIVKTKEKILNILHISHTTLITAKDAALERFILKDNKLKNQATFHTSFSFSRITSLCTTPSGDIVVCDANSQAIICINMSGDISWCYPQSGSMADNSQTSMPTAATCDPQGNVFVVSKENNSVVKIAPAGDAWQTIATRLSVQNPIAIGTDITGTLFVSQGNGEVKIMSSGVSYC